MHIDRDLLSLLVMGESVGDEGERVHAQTCPECADELQQLRHLVTIGHGVTAEMTMADPGPNVWAAIRNELGLDLTLEPPARRSTSSLLNAVTSHTVDRSVAADSDHELTAHAQLAPVETLWSRASGRARLATDEHGRRVLQVALDADLPTSGVRQAWLIHRDDPTRLQTLGILDGKDGLWTVDHSIDLEDYAILDISQQRTGEATHSGHTIVRGELMLAS